MSDKKGRKQKGGLGKKLAAVVVLAGVGLGAAFWFAPETMQAQLQALREMLGV